MRESNSRKILAYLFFAGAIAIACTSPYFIPKVIKYFFKNQRYKFSDEKKTTDAFNYLRKRGLIMVEKIGYDVKITLTKEGKNLARKYQVDDVKIDKPKVWDKLWRFVIFDIPDNQRIKRNAFRGKLKELGFYSLQKSVWVHPFNCDKEINFLRDFFGLNKKQIEILLVKHIENDIITKKIKDVYKI